MIAGVGASGQLNYLYPQYQVEPVNRVQGVNKVTGKEETNEIDRTKETECQTCKARRYVDGSDEGNVSFKEPGYISPEASGAVVRSHEQEHVANAESEGSTPGKELLSASVSLKMAVCPECGKSYVSGGTTTTTMKYSSNPYDQGRKTIEGSFLKGKNVDLVA